MLVSLLMAELGVHSVAYAFPRVKIVTTAVDKSLDDLLHVIPGIGKVLHVIQYIYTMHICDFSDKVAKAFLCLCV